MVGGGKSYGLIPLWLDCGARLPGHALADLHNSLKFWIWELKGLWGAKFVVTMNHSNAKSSQGIDLEQSCKHLW
jgi:hypothetical protein